MNARTKAKILIIDDHPLMRSGVIRAIEEENDYVVCGEAEDVEPAILEIEKKSPDLIVADVSLKNSNGFDLIKWLKATKKKIPVLMISMHEEPIYIERAFKAGAKGYLLKQESTKQVTKAIRQILQGRTYISESLASSYFEGLSYRETSDTIIPKDILSKREGEVFTLLGEGLTRQEIADRMKVSINTVDSHIEHIKTKLNVTSGMQVIHLAVRQSMKSK